MCDALFDLPFWICLTNFIQLDFQLRQSSQQNLLTRKFVVFKLRCESFLCYNKLPTVETSLLTQIIFYLHAMPNLVMNIFLSSLSELWASHLPCLRSSTFPFQCYTRKPLLQKLTSDMRLCEGPSTRKIFAVMTFSAWCIPCCHLQRIPIVPAFSINCESRVSSLVICLEHLLSRIYITVSSFYMLCITNRLSFLVPSLAWVQMG